jgi:hypothetical protein
MKCVTANELAGNDLNDQKSFRRALRDAALRDADLKWHQKNARWETCTDSEIEAMQSVRRDWLNLRPR